MSDNLPNSPTTPTKHIERSVNNPSIYASAGVNINAGSKAVKMMSNHAKSTGATTTHQQTP